MSYKLTSIVNEQKLFCYGDTVSEINQMEFSIHDKPPDGSASFLLFHNVEINVIMLFGDTTIRFIKFQSSRIESKHDCSRIESKRDYKRIR